ncbi:CRISPR-associated endonuclease Cas3'' [Amycolatopsis sp. EV170708-02-1]|uniref:CRISPR-associated endonuclease Cas3'' n=1 Tax=Amycolatopsis sp. EV170708-02-1 TaxID=2919322 RepID=UPI001F0C4921|nr:CRISPR-associated endonuclease Cas3'' [Amycolatopsis sp. EV170708-02-1]UMO99985.1 CRISPR-associated endonuclease Cas3'' [Amycolatopsis sp. EV170708-02-1]
MSSVWAKSNRDEVGAVTEWLPLQQHLDDTISVARLLIDHWVSPQVSSRIERDFVGDGAAFRAVACWLAGCHDVGKASPAFSCQVDVLADRMRQHGFPMQPRLSEDPGRRAVNHALVGQWAARDWLADEAGFDFAGTAVQWGSVIGSHHGVAPEESQLALVDSSSHLTGSGVWERVRAELFAWVTGEIGGLDVLKNYAGMNVSMPAQVLITAVVIVADWIASNSDLFPLAPISETAFHPSAARTTTAWGQLNLPPRWAAQSFGGDVDQLFRARFGPVHTVARPVQAAAVMAAAEQSVPGMLIVEAPMGSGKTEAALLAAEVLANRSGRAVCSSLCRLRRRRTPCTGGFGHGWTGFR